MCVLRELRMHTSNSARLRSPWRVAGFSALLLAAVCAALPTIFAGAAEAADESVVVTDSAGPLLTGWNRTLELAKHDPERGALRSVDVTIKATTSGSIQSENISNQDAQIGGTLAAEVAFSSQAPIEGTLQPSIERVETAAPDDGSLDYEGSSGRTWQDLESGQAIWTQSFDSEADLAAFQGDGNVAIDVQARTRTRVAPENSSKVQTFAQVTVTVEYHVRQPSVSGYFWNDANENGTQDQGEPGIPGIVAMLVSNGQVVSSASSGSAGGFRISPVPSGDYELVLGQPLGYKAITGPDNLKVGESGVVVPVTVKSDNVRIDVGFAASSAEGVAPTKRSDATTTTTSAVASSSAAPTSTTSTPAATTTTKASATTALATSTSTTTTQRTATTSTTDQTNATAATATSGPRSGSGTGGADAEVAGASEQAAGTAANGLAATGSAERSLYVASLLLLMVGLGCMIVSANARRS